MNQSEMSEITRWPETTNAFGTIGLLRCTVRTKMITIQIPDRFTKM